MRRVGFVVFPGYQVMGFAVISVFEIANFHAGNAVYDIRLLSEAGGRGRHILGDECEHTAV
jgi:transcriptional regulator GlxA family with amidase domain